MARRHRLGLGVAAVLVVASATGICVAPPAAPRPIADPRPLSTAVAPPEIAVTLARERVADGRARHLLVVGLDGDAIRAIDLDALGADPARSSLDVFAAFGRERLVALATAPSSATLTVPLAALLPTATGESHVAAGTNFPEHAREVGIARPFFFPKFGPATPAVTSIAHRTGMLIDHEVEICLVADRAMRTVGDFDAATKGFFLCGDFTDRARLMRLLPDEERPSGIGFSDAKSGPDFLPTGPFLVVPTDWRAFVAAERIATEVDGTRWQDAAGSDMTFDFRRLVENVLAVGAEPRWRFEGRAVALIEGGVVPAGATVMSGTPEGVLFRPPDTREIVCGIAAYVCLGGFLTAPSARVFVVERHVARLRAAGVFHAPGRQVRHLSTHLGAIAVTVR